MKTVLTAAAALVFLAGAAAADEGPYELRLDQKNGERTIAVSNAVSGAFAVAAGGKRLDLLSSKDAEAALKRLKNGPDLDIDLGGEKDERKIVIHKMDFDDGDGDAADDSEVEDDSNPEVRILKRHQRDDDDVSPDDGLSDDLFSMQIDGDDDAVLERRIMLIKGAGARTAATFIDKIDGLEADEKAAMKDAAGL
jgi:hypothetical protein